VSDSQFSQYRTCDPDTGCLTPTSGVFGLCVVCSRSWYAPVRDLPRPGAMLTRGLIRVRRDVLKAEGGGLSVPRGEAVEVLAAGAVDWLLGVARDTEMGLAWPAFPSDADVDPTLYSGAAGIVLALLEAHRHFRDDRYGDAALRGARAIAAAVDQETCWSLYFGVTGMAVTLRAVSDHLGDAPAGAAADRALDRVRAHFDGQRWSGMFELLYGNAGIALGALHAGDIELALVAVTPYLHTADPTPGGVNWAVRPTPARSHHIAHGTLGIVYALAAVAAATGRTELLEVALAGASDVVARHEGEPLGFLVPHSIHPTSPS
jgi:hypothetical protein